MAGLAAWVWRHTSLFSLSLQGDVALSRVCFSAFATQNLETVLIATRRPQEKPRIPIKAQQSWLHAHRGAQATP
ncbi:hypothetical protein Q7C36_003409 [Tachysurus vachellii]|uniref:Secreted protein n=1 Tax=Tachysurus vachellii TaxID=175792 RepID=A0AA88T987_TACVA|nr:hypothetical protein Q7C36_003409 [Tachysurus vachellii]